MIWPFEKRSASTLAVYDRKMLQPYQISCLERSVYYASWHTCPSMQANYCAC